MNRTARQNHLNGICVKLAKHFDAVVILATWQDDGETVTHTLAEGNVHARINMARDYVSVADARTTCHIIADAINDNDPPDFTS